MLKIYFTNDEMKLFLEKQGYTIKSVSTWRSYNTYHNQVEENSYTTDIAIKDSTKFSDSNETYNSLHIDKYSLEFVFIEEMKRKLLSL
jgi:hypothetical protein